MNHQSNKPSCWSIVLSTFAAALGVQNKKNLEKDFTYGNIYVYIAAGIIFTAFFVLTVIIVVRMVLANSGM